MDGLGWLHEKHGRCMARYGWTERFCWTGISTAKSAVYDNLAKEQEITAFGPLWERKSPGYVKQEIEKRLKHGRRKNQR